MQGGFSARACRSTVRIVPSPDGARNRQGGVEIAEGRRFLSRGRMQIEPKQYDAEVDEFTCGVWITLAFGKSPGDNDRD